jgi:5-methylcytosine-specific restriction endonuclease McrA
MKLCKKCNETKELSCFSKDKTRKDGLQPYCKECTSKYKKKHRTENAKKISEYQKEYREKNKQSLSKYHKEYLDNGGREVRKRYRQNNPDKIKALKSNNEHKRRRAKTESDLTGTEFAFWVDNELKTCVYCGTNCTNNFHVDHIEPLSNNGEHAINNLAISCPTCNLSKGSKSIITFLAYKKKQ